MIPCRWRLFRANGWRLLSLVGVVVRETFDSRGVRTVIWPKLAGSSGFRERRLLCAKAGAATRWL